MWLAAFNQRFSSIVVRQLSTLFIKTQNHIALPFESLRFVRRSGQEHVGLWFADSTRVVEALYCCTMHWKQSVLELYPLPGYAAFDSLEFHPNRTSNEAYQQPPNIERSISSLSSDKQLLCIWVTLYTILIGASKANGKRVLQKTMEKRSKQANMTPIYLLSVH